MGFSNLPGTSWLDPDVLEEQFRASYACYDHVDEHQCTCAGRRLYTDKYIEAIFRTNEQQNKLLVYASLHHERVYIKIKARHQHPLWCGYYLCDVHSNCPNLLRCHFDCACQHNNARSCGHQRNGGTSLGHCEIEWGDRRGELEALPYRQMGVHPCTVARLRHLDDLWLGHLEP